ncbi:MAG: RNA methyltransferase [Myxococcota bacterium]
MSDAAQRAADHLCIVLVEPQHPGNVGAAARAMKNMGLRHLVIVAPSPSFDMERARWMAPGAGDVLDQMRITSTLAEALEGIHRVYATTARHRRHGQPVLEPPDVAQRVLDDAEDSIRSAVLFGREDCGLSADDALRAVALVRIPTARHASLNLAQAVLLCAHHVFEEARRRGAVAEGRVLGGGRTPKSTHRAEKKARSALPVDVNAIEPALVELVAVLNRVGFGRGTSPEKVGATLREGFQRAGLSPRQLGAIRGMVARVNFALDNPQVDWTMSRRQRAKVDALADEERPPSTNEDGHA